MLLIRVLQYTKFVWFEIFKISLQIYILNLYLSFRNSRIEFENVKVRFNQILVQIEYLDISTISCSNELKVTIYPTFWFSIRVPFSIVLLDELVIRQCSKNSLCFFSQNLSSPISHVCKISATIDQATIYFQIEDVGLRYYMFHQQFSM